MLHIQLKFVKGWDLSLELIFMSRVWNSSNRWPNPQNGINVTFWNTLVVDISPLGCTRYVNVGLIIH